MPKRDEKFIPPFEVKSDASTWWRSAMCYSSTTKWIVKNEKIENACLGTHFLFSWFLSNDPWKEPLFKSPEKFKLAKDKSVEKKEQVIDRKDQDPIQDRKPSRMIFMKQPLCNDRFDKHHSETRACKNYQYNDDLPGWLDMPSIL